MFYSYIYQELISYWINIVLSPIGSPIITDIDIIMTDIIQIDFCKVLGEWTMLNFYKNFIVVVLLVIYPLNHILLTNFTMSLIWRRNLYNPPIGSVGHWFWAISIPSIHEGLPWKTNIFHYLLLLIIILHAWRDNNGLEVL